MPQRRGNVEAQAISLPKLERSQTWDPSFQTVGTRSEDVKERMGVEERHCDALSKFESKWNRGFSSVKRWESEKHKS